MGLAVPRFSMLTSKVWLTDADAQKYWAVIPPSDDGGTDESN